MRGRSCDNVTSHKRLDKRGLITFPASTHP